MQNFNADNTIGVTINNCILAVDARKNIMPKIKQILAKYNAIEVNKGTSVFYKFTDEDKAFTCAKEILNITTNTHDEPSEDS